MKDVQISIDLQLLAYGNRIYRTNTRLTGDSPHSLAINMVSRMCAIAVQTTTPATNPPGEAQVTVELQIDDPAIGEEPAYKAFTAAGSTSLSANELLNEIVEDIAGRACDWIRAQENSAVGKKEQD